MDPNCNEVFIDDLPTCIDVQFLKELFEDYGHFPTDSIFVKKQTKPNKAYAFVTFKSHELAKRAIEELNYTKLDGVPIRMYWGDPYTMSLARSDANTLLIRGLAENIEVSQLHDAFSNFGNLVTCKIPLTNLKSCGYGLVTFYSEEDARSAQNDLRDAAINGKPVEITFYQKQSQSQTNLNQIKPKRKQPQSILKM
ncbi:hypothetical protein TVAG_278520 [Trichomonas vaginalis G3]|uniref:RRM domain-containing protein n=1 Tax=Trichomonas vaginalis (strain ATCC PRA-98 / G3) TaxID=412133 RepID=A2DU93_TRIV3|nr:RNA binding [Trichomonas vaginalis G3]EAY16086.1 hypothetical protein TVAG_278520 [Trichomonas vaginalis G3]KAI5537248.1 RNA binding [Trichomonas vaginalis G3]|eukprot:XP_001328309.1 hypothetical protein [Trichomonas vaginalis G3]